MTGLRVISLARAQQGEEAKAADEASRACAESGWFLVCDHGIDREVFDNAYALSLDFFRRLTPTAYGVGRLVLDDTRQLPFPADKRGIALRDALRTYFTACRGVADRVAQLLTPAAERPHAGESTGDPLITLFAKDGPGLQLRDASGTWIDVDVPERDWFVVGVGDRPHRVRPTEGPRQSIVLVTPATDGAVIECSPKPTPKRPASYLPSRHELFSPQEMDALFGREEVRS